MPTVHMPTVRRRQSLVHPWYVHVSQPFQKKKKNGQKYCSHVFKNNLDSEKNTWTDVAATCKLLHKLIDLLARDSKIEDYTGQCFVDLSETMEGINN